MIPLHMIWLGTGLDEQKTLDARLHCEDVRLYTDDSELMPQWREAYDTCTSTIQSKSDLLRLSVLRKYGGLYIDFDVSIFAAPEVITEGWNSLSVCSIGEAFVMNGDVIYCPLEWPHWELVDSYIDAFAANKQRNHMQFGNELFLPLFFKHRVLSPIMLGAEMVKDGVTVMRRFNLPPQMSMPAAQSKGPGTELKKILARFGITSTENCPCNAHAKQMNLWGDDECEKPERMEQIIGWLREQAEGRGLPFIRAAAAMLVRMSIRASRRSRVLGATPPV